MANSHTHSHVGLAPLSIDYAAHDFAYTIEGVASLAPRRVAAKFSPCLRKYRWDPYAVLLADTDVERVKKSYRRTTAPAANARTGVQSHPQALQAADANKKDSEYDHSDNRSSSNHNNNNDHHHSHHHHHHHHHHNQAPLRVQHRPQPQQERQPVAQCLQVQPNHHQHQRPPHPHHFHPQHRRPQFPPHHGRRLHQPWPSRQPMPWRPMGTALSGEWDLRPGGLRTPSGGAGVRLGGAVIRST